jgi:hypothetical protein
VNRFSVLGLALLLAAAACSEQVPAPVTPTPSPRPGHPPAPLSALPEGVLLVQRSPTSKPPMLAIDTTGEAHAYEWEHVLSVSPEKSRAILVQSGRAGGFKALALLKGIREEPINAERWGFKTGEGWPYFVWSPDGRRVAYVLPAASGVDQVSVWTADPEGGGRRDVTEGAPPDYYFPAAWTAMGEVLIRGNARLLLAGEDQREIRLPEPNEILDFAVSLDGSRVAAMMGYYEERPEHADFAVARATGLWALDTPTGTWRLLNDLGSAEWQPWIGAGMSWSPDGHRIAYYETYVGDEVLIRTGLTVIDTTTGEQTRLHGQGQYPHAWSHDGKYLAYWYDPRGPDADPNAKPTLGILGPDGKREKNRTVRGMAWSATGRLLFQRDNGISILDPVTFEEAELLTDEGEPVRVHLGLDELQGLIWSPSGRYIAAATPSDQYIAGSLYIIDTEEGVARLFYDRAGFYPLAWLKE